MSETGGVCELCGHLFDPHAVVATTGAPEDGGIILCPVPGCRCYRTWGFNGAPTVREPDEAEVAELRRTLQSAPGAEEG
ncbi:hypothetical protein ACLESD_29770 [Pyxidicoccus sp. 3LFB2]